jgi:hypothetical protein
VETGCGCVASTLKDSVLAPGAETPLEITFSGMPGNPKQAYTVTLLTDESEGARAVLMTAATVLSPLVLDPPALRFVPLRKGESKEAAVVLRRQDRRPFTLTEAHVYKLPVEFNWEEFTDEEGRGYRIRAVARGLQPGRIGGIASFQTDGPGGPQAKLSIYIEVDGEVVPEPRSVRSRAAADGAADFELQLARTTPGPLEVRSVGEGKGLQPEWSAEPVADGRCRLRVRLRPKPGNPLSSGELVVVTSAEPDPVRVPYYVEVPRR